MRSKRLTQAKQVVAKQSYFEVARGQNRKRLTENSLNRVAREGWAETVWKHSYSVKPKKLISFGMSLVHFEMSTLLPYCNTTAVLLGELPRVLCVYINRWCFVLIRDSR